MSDHDRGPYTPPSEPPLAFDPRRPVRGAGPAPVTLIVSVVILVAAAGAAFFVYRGGVRGANDAPQPVGAPVRDVKSAPPPEAKVQDPAQGLSVYKDNTPGATTAAPTFAPPPEQPGPRPAPQVAAHPTTPVGSQALPPPPPPPPVAQAKPEPVAPAASPAKPATPPKSIAAILDQKSVRDAPVPPARPHAVVAAAKPTPSGAAFVQIGAFSSQALAEKGWNDAARIAPGAMAGKGKHVEPVTKDGATLYRTAITGFASKDEANALCDKLKAAGKTCFVR
ncbi:SPOR domain-containing protein [Caulobacter sp. KR2-114]|uniref:cell division protein FtsN n=1 Tax=Caulobacter sp. KR2-114 TaxID=3400912 RepID=UPI003C106DD4